MGGEPPPRFAPPPVAPAAPVVLDVKALTLPAHDTAAPPLLDGVDLTVRAGEIVGVAGVEGNGQRELVRALAGLEPRATGKVSVAGADVSELGARGRRPWLGVVHEDRHAEGILLDATVGDNLVLGDLGDPGGVDEAATIARRIERFGVHPPDPARLSGELSGRQPAEDRDRAGPRPPRGDTGWRGQEGRDPGAADARGRRGGRGGDLPGHRRRCRRGDRRAGPERGPDGAAARCPTGSWSCGGGRSWPSCRATRRRRRSGGRCWGRSRRP